MDAAAIPAIITSLATLVAAIGSCTAVIMGVINRQGIHDIKHATDGMKDALVKATGDLRYSEGVTQGEDNPRNPDTGPIKVEITKVPTPVPVAVVAPPVKK